MYPLRCPGWWWSIWPPFPLGFVIRGAVVSRLMIGGVLVAIGPRRPNPYLVLHWRSCGTAAAPTTTSTTTSTGRTLVLAPTVSPQVLSTSTRTTTTSPLHHHLDLLRSSTLLVHCSLSQKACVFGAVGRFSGWASGRRGGPTGSGAHVWGKVWGRGALHIELSAIRGPTGDNFHVVLAGVLLFGSLALHSYSETERQVLILKHVGMAFYKGGEWDGNMPLYKLPRKINIIKIIQK